MTYDAIAIAAIVIAANAILWREISNLRAELEKIHRKIIKFHGDNNS